MLKVRSFSVLAASTAIVCALSVFFTVPALAAAHIPAQGDALWCPSGVKPKPGKGGCTMLYSNLFDLAAALGSVAPANGEIWIKQGVDSSASDIKIDGTVLTGLANDTLKVQGGWTGTPAGKASGTTTFSSPIYVLSWGNAVTVQDVTVANDGGASGLGIVTTGNINVNRFTSDSNVAYGAALHSFGGAIAVANSAFTNNAFTGILVDATSSSVLTNVTASNNAKNGMEATGLGNVVVNCSDISNNAAYGIDASASGGSLTLNGVTLVGNVSGAYVAAGTVTVNPTCP